jgi:hypothetical protein
VSKGTPLANPVFKNQLEFLGAGRIVFDSLNITTGYNWYIIYIIHI